MKLRGAIFDLDGTMLDSMIVWDTLGAAFLTRRGILPRADLNDHLKSMSLAQAALYFQTAYGLSDDCDSIVADITAQIASFYQNEALAKPGVPAFLETLRGAGVRMCIATATDHALAEAALRRNGLLHYIVDILTSATVGSGKDAPAIFDAALAVLGTDKEATIVFEDALHAVQTAKRAGYRVVALQDDAAEPDREHIRALADRYFQSFGDIKLNELDTFL